MIDLAKVFFDKFIRGNVLIVAIALAMVILSATAFYFKVSYDNTKQEYSQHLINDAVAVKFEKEKNKIIEDSARKSTALEIAKHKKVITTLQVNETELKKKVGDLYAIKTNSDFRLASYRDLQLLQASGNNVTSTEPASDPEQSASCRGKLDAADTRLSIVEEACAVTTADFNLARGWIDGVCNVHKCTGEDSQ